MGLRDIVDAVLGRNGYVSPEVRDTWGVDYYGQLDVKVHDVDLRGYQPRARVAQWYPGALLDCKVPYHGHLLGRAGYSSAPVSGVPWFMQTPVTNLPKYSRQLVGLAPLPTPGPLTLQRWMSRGLGQFRTEYGAPGNVPALFPFLPD